MLAPLLRIAPVLHHVALVVLLRRLRCAVSLLSCRLVASLRHVTPHHITLRRVTLVILPSSRCPCLHCVVLVLALALVVSPWAACLLGAACSDMRFGPAAEMEGLVGGQGGVHMQAHTECPSIRNLMYLSRF